MVFSWRHSSEQQAEDGSFGATVAAGKVTLTRVLYRREGGARAPARDPVASEPQRVGPDPFDFSTHALGGELELARAGFAGTPAPFPHRDAIERSFGRSLPATAYTDAAASSACAALGAEGYALGDQVAFGTATPSLELAAHEAAHVLQASQGVELFGGASAFEAHADEVAARVVRGESAADLFGGSPAVAAVRKQTRGAQSTATSGTAASAEQPAAAAPTGRTRMTAAIVARDVPAVVALFRELVPVAREVAPPSSRAGARRGGTARARCAGGPERAGEPGHAGASCAARAGRAGASRAARAGGAAGQRRGGAHRCARGHHQWPALSDEGDR